MASRSLIFVVNPGSASRKYAIYSSGQKIAGIHFEIVGNKVIANLEHTGGRKTVEYSDGNLGNAAHRILPLLREYNVIDTTDKIAAIGIRIVAPSERFEKDQVITEAIIKSLESLSKEVPLHIKVALLEIKQLKVRFPRVPIIAVSDSAFHTTKPDKARYYGIDTRLAKRFGILRYGYHGISVGSSINYLKKHDMLMSKVIVCHLGSGSSITAVKDGKSIDNTMGYSPLEGLLMSTRSGSIDVSAALVIKRALKLTDNNLEQYLDKQAGLFGVSGSSDDIRQLLAKEAKGDDRAKLALSLYVYRVQQAIGQMSASLGGVNCLVFTGTVGERSAVLRGRILKQLGYLGFEFDMKANSSTYEPSEVSNLATVESKPILVLLTDEAVEIARRTRAFIQR